MKKINLLVELPYEKLFNFLKNNGKEIVINEYVQAHSFLRTFDLALNTEKTIKLRIEMRINYDNDYHFVSFNSKIFYKNAFNEDYETFYIFNNYEKFNELSHYLDYQINSYLKYSEINNLPIVVSETISDDIQRIGKKQLADITNISKQAELFKKFVDTGLEKPSPEFSFPKDIVNNSLSNVEEETQGNFTEEEVRDINNLFDSIKDTVEKQISQSIAHEETTSYSDALTEELVTFNEEDLKNLLFNPSEELLQELIDISLDENNIERFYYYSDLLNSRKIK